MLPASPVSAPLGTCEKFVRTRDTGRSAHAFDVLLVVSSVACTLLLVAVGLLVCAVRLLQRAAAAVVAAEAAAAAAPRIAHGRGTDPVEERLTTFANSVDAAQPLLTNIRDTDGGGHRDLRVRPALSSVPRAIPGVMDALRILLQTPRRRAVEKLADLEESLPSPQLVAPHSPQSPPQQGTPKEKLRDEEADAAHPSLQWCGELSSDGAAHKFDAVAVTTPVTAVTDDKNAAQAPGAFEATTPKDIVVYHTTQDSRYRLLRRIGRGAFSSVYLVQHKGTGVPYALKYIVCADDRARLSAVRECEVLNRLQGHPNIPCIVDMFMNYDFQKGPVASTSTPTAGRRATAGVPTSSSVLKAATSALASLQEHGERPTAGPVRSSAQLALTMCPSQAPTLTEKIVTEAASQRAARPAAAPLDRDAAHAELDESLKGTDASCDGQLDQCPEHPSASPSPQQEQQQQQQSTQPVRMVVPSDRNDAAVEFDTLQPSVLGLSFRDDRHEAGQHGKVMRSTVSLAPLAERDTQQGTPMLSARDTERVIMDARRLQQQRRLQHKKHALHRHIRPQLSEMPSLKPSMGAPLHQMTPNPPGELRVIRSSSNSCSSCNSTISVSSSCCRPHRTQFLPPGSTGVSLDHCSNIAAAATDATATPSQGESDALTVSGSQALTESTNLHSSTTKAVKYRQSTVPRTIAGRRSCSAGYDSVGKETSTAVQRRPAPSTLYAALDTDTHCSGSGSAKQGFDAESQLPHMSQAVGWKGAVEEDEVSRKGGAGDAAFLPGFPSRWSAAVERVAPVPSANGRDGVASGDGSALAAGDPPTESHRSPSYLARVGRGNEPHLETEASSSSEGGDEEPFQPIYPLTTSRAQQGGPTWTTGSSPCSHTPSSRLARDGESIASAVPQWPSAVAPQDPPQQPMQATSTSAVDTSPALTASPSQTAMVAHASTSISGVVKSPTTGTCKSPYLERACGGEVVPPPRTSYAPGGGVRYKSLTYPNLRVPHSDAVSPEEYLGGRSGGGGAAAAASGVSEKHSMGTSEATQGRCPEAAPRRTYAPLRYGNLLASFATPPPPRNDTPAAASVEAVSAQKVFSVGAAHSGGSVSVAAAIGDAREAQQHWQQGEHICENNGKAHLGTPAALLSVGSRSPAAAATATSSSWSSPIPAASGATSGLTGTRWTPIGGGVNIFSNSAPGDGRTVLRTPITTAELPPPVSTLPLGPGGANDRKSSEDDPTAAPAAPNIRYTNAGNPSLWRARAADAPSVNAAAAAAVAALSSAALPQPNAVPTLAPAATATVALSTPSESSSSGSLQRDVRDTGYLCLVTEYHPLGDLGRYVLQLKQLQDLHYRQRLSLGRVPTRLAGEMGGPRLGEGSGAGGGADSASEASPPTSGPVLSVASQSRRTEEEEKVSQCFHMAPTAVAAADGAGDTSDVDDRPLTEPQLLSIAFQLASVLDYMHGQSPPVVHRDLKPENILLKGKRSEYADGALTVTTPTTNTRWTVAGAADSAFTGAASATSSSVPASPVSPANSASTPTAPFRITRSVVPIVLTDFGLAISLDGQGRPRGGRGGGTRPYIAPECWYGRPCPASDIWSLGCVLYALATGRLTADTVRIMSEEAKIDGFASRMLNDILAQKYSLAFASFVVSLLVVEAAKRPTAAQASRCFCVQDDEVRFDLTSPFFSNVLDL